MYWLTLNQNAVMQPGLVRQLGLAGSLTPGQIGWGLIVGALPVAAICAALWHLRVMFRLYGQGVIFSGEAAARLHGVAISFICFSIAQLVREPLLSLGLTWQTAVGGPSINLSLGASDLALWFLAGMLLVVARVMREAHRLDEENRLVV